MGVNDRGRLTRSLVFRVAKSDYMYIANTASRFGMSISEFLRVLIKDKRMELYDTLLLFDISRELRELSHKFHLDNERLEGILIRLREFIDRNKNN
jgi:hypothetical protein